MTQVIIEGIILAILIEAVILAVLAGVAYVIYKKNNSRHVQNNVSLLKKDACEIMDLLEAIDKLNNSK